MRLVRVRSGANPQLAAEIYYDPVRNLAWERIPSSHHDRQPRWLIGNTHDHRRLDESVEELELARVIAITEVRDRATSIERRLLLRTVIHAVQALRRPFWAEDMVNVMLYYLLALYPAVIPEPLTAVDRLVRQATRAGHIPSYDFRGLHSGWSARKKEHHIGDACEHITYGAVYIDGVLWPVERCSYHPTFCIRMRDSEGTAHVLPNAYVDATMSRL